MLPRLLGPQTALTVVQFGCIRELRDAMDRWRGPHPLHLSLSYGLVSGPCRSAAYNLLIAGTYAHHGRAAPGDASLARFWRTKVVPGLAWSVLRDSGSVGGGIVVAPYVVPRDASPPVKFLGGLGCGACCGLARSCSTTRRSRPIAWPRPAGARARSGRARLCRGARRARAVRELPYRVAVIALWTGILHVADRPVGVITSSAAPLDRRHASSSGGASQLPRRRPERSCLARSAVWFDVIARRRAGLRAGRPGGRPLEMPPRPLARMGSGPRVALPGRELVQCKVVERDARVREGRVDFFSQHRDLPKQLERVIISLGPERALRSGLLRLDPVHVRLGACSERCQRFVQQRGLLIPPFRAPPVAVARFSLNVVGRLADRLHHRPTTRPARSRCSTPFTSGQSRKSTSLPPRFRRHAAVDKNGISSPSECRGRAMKHCLPLHHRPRRSSGNRNGSVKRRRATTTPTLRPRRHPTKIIPSTRFDQLLTSRRQAPFST